MNSKWLMIQNLSSLSGVHRSLSGAPLVNPQRTSDLITTARLQAVHASSACVVDLKALCI